MRRRRVRVQWTVPARDALAELPRKIRRAILEKTRSLAECTEPRKAHKPLVGPLQGYYSMKVSRYRYLYRVDEEKLPNGKVVVRVTILVLLVGKRKGGERDDVYRLAEKLLRWSGWQFSDHPDEDIEPKL